MDKGSHQENHQAEQLEDAVADRILVDVFKPKAGSERDIVVFTFLVDQRHAALKLSRFISQGPFDLLDVESSPAPDEEGHFLVFLEMQRNRNMFGTMDDILEHVGFMVNVEKWRFRPYGHKTFIDWNRESFIKTVPQSPDEYESAGEKSNNDRPAEVLEDKPGELIESSQLSLQQLIEHQINRHSKAYIRSLQEQIQAVIQDNQQLVERVEELKKEQQYLHQQVEFYQKRENMSLQREEQIYERIRDMESKIEMLGATDSEEIESITSDPVFAPASFGDDIVVDTAESDLMDTDDIQLSPPGIDLYSRGQTGQVSDAIDSVDSVDSVDSTMFELETSLGMSPAESFLSEDELLDEDEHFDSVDEAPVIEDTVEGVDSVEEADADLYSLDESMRTFPEADPWRQTDEVVAGAEPDVASLTISDDVADPASALPASATEIETDTIDSDDDEDQRQYESVADLPPSTQQMAEEVAAAAIESDSVFNTETDSDLDAMADLDPTAAEPLAEASEMFKDSGKLKKDQDQTAAAMAAEKESPVSEAAALPPSALDPTDELGAETAPAAETDEDDRVGPDVESATQWGDASRAEAEVSKEDVTASGPPADGHDDPITNEAVETELPAFDDQDQPFEALLEADPLSDEQEVLDDEPIMDLDEPLDEAVGNFDLAMIEPIVPADEKIEPPVEQAEKTGVPRAANQEEKDEEISANDASSDNQVDSDDEAIVELDAPVEQADGRAEEAAGDWTASYEEKDEPVSEVQIDAADGSTILGDPADPPITDIYDAPAEMTPSGPDKDIQPNYAVGRSTDAQPADSDDTDRTAGMDEEFSQKHEDETAGEMDAVQPVQEAPQDLSHLEDTIHELESIVVTETDSEKTSEPVGANKGDAPEVKDQVKQYLKLGNEAYQNSRYLKAIEYFSKAVELTPEAPVGHLNLAVLAYRLSDYEGAANHARRAINLGSQSAVRILEKAKSKIQADESDKPIQSSPQKSEPSHTGQADDSGSEVIELGPEDEVAHRKDSRIEETAEPEDIDDRGADTPSPAMRQPSESTPSDLPAPVATRREQTAERDIANEYFALGLTASDHKKYAEAFDYFKKAVELTPDIPAGHQNLAVIAYRLKDYHQAMDYAEKAIAGGSRSARKIMDKAAAKLNTNPESTDDSTDSTGRPSAVVDASDGTPSESESSAAVGLKPQEDTGTAATGPVDTQSAASAPPAAASQGDEKTSPDADGELFEPEEKTAPDKAERETESSEEPGRIDDEKSGASEYFTLGLAASEKKNYAQASEYFQRVVALSPASPAGYLNLAVLAYRQKDYSTSQQYAQQALALGSQSARKILDKSTQKLETQHRADGAEGQEKAGEAQRVDGKDGRAKKAGDDDSLSPAAATHAGLTVEEEEIVFETTRERKSKESAETADEQSRPSNKAVFQKGATTADTELANEYFRLGVEASEQKAFEKSIRYFTKVTEILPSARRSYIKLAVLYYQIKDFKTSKELAQKAIELGSTSARKILKKSEAKLQQLHKDSSEKQKQLQGMQTPVDGHLEPEEKDGPGQGAATEMNKQAEPSAIESPAESNDVSEPPPAAARSTDDQPTEFNDEAVTKNYSVNEYFAMGLAASERKDYHQAIEYFTKVTELLPNASPSFLNLANLYLNLEDYATARQHAQRALDLGSKSAQRILDDVDALSK